MGANGIDFIETGFMEMFSETRERGPESGRPERPSPLRPGTEFIAGLSAGFPFRDETDLIFAANNSWASWFLANETGLLEGDFYGR
jgi:hypothetical protein